MPTPVARDSKGRMLNSRQGGDSLPDAALNLLPTPAVNDMDRGKTPEDWDEWTQSMRERHGNGNGLTDFGPYAAAIHRWEQVLGRPAPPPTEPGMDGRPRLSPRFVEHMMGLPDGWVCDTGIPRNAQLKALGNGVVPQQAALALSILLPRLYGGEAAKDAEEVA